ncbi:MAG: hypothetical protein ABI589_03115 [Burkholderiales bacterium]
MLAVIRQVDPRINRVSIIAAKEPASTIGKRRPLKQTSNNDSARNLDSLSLRDFRFTVLSSQNLKLARGRSAQQRRHRPGIIGRPCFCSVLEASLRLDRVAVDVLAQLRVERWLQTFVETLFRARHNQPSHGLGQVPAIEMLVHETFGERPRGMARIVVLAHCTPPDSSLGLAA